MEPDGRSDGRCEVLEILPTGETWTRITRCRIDPSNQSLRRTRRGTDGDLRMDVRERIVILEVHPSKPITAKATQ